MSSAKTTKDLKTSGSSTQKNTHPWGSGKILAGTSKPATPHPAQQNGCESNSTINNKAEKIYGAGTHNDFSGATFN